MLENKELTNKKERLCNNNCNVQIGNFFKLESSPKLTLTIKCWLVPTNSVVIESLFSDNKSTLLDGKKIYKFI